MLEFDEEALRAGLPGHLSTMKIKSIKVINTVTHGDGSVTNYGVGAYWSSNPFKMFWWKIQQFFKR